ncbi:adenosylcobinamide-phosphate synthase [Candidatus Hakubella thermalkaliphila]|uniref:Cobalamin biosynthesis protein CobD n=1 Tax=Candidatus Hakubella thermalkaliphila TaxID=2754717 RepID=A0A6V8NM66_9ACTN|nr:adenosylcobinamide-phosphate synthase [Candidatus Hakubella thermalkaliphila]
MVTPLIYYSFLSPVPLAYLLDLIIGDPRWLPHPVVGIGRLVSRGEKVLLRPTLTSRQKRVRGIILGLGILSIAWAAAWSIVKISYLLNPFLGYLVSVGIIFTTLAGKNLAARGLAIRKAILRGDLERAREIVSQIVGRDTKNLDFEDLIRATVESIAENTVDGIVAPLFYAFVGGAPLAMAYRAINTLDSMVGYKKEPYLHFGWASARMDDVANYIPARLNMLFISLAALCLGMDGRRAWRTARRDGRKHASPNSGLSEAAMAGALGVQLGGRSFYGGKEVFHPFLGNKVQSLSPEHIRKAVFVSLLSSLICLILGMSVVIFLHWWA